MNWNAFLFSEFCDNWQLFGHTFTKNAWNLKRATFLLFVAFDIWACSLSKFQLKCKFMKEHISINRLTSCRPAFENPQNACSIMFFSQTERWVYKGVKKSHDLKGGFWLAESHRSRDFLRQKKIRHRTNEKPAFRSCDLNKPISGQHFPDPTIQISISSFQTLIPNSLMIFLPSAIRWVGKKLRWLSLDFDKAECIGVFGVSHR